MEITFAQGALNQEFCADVAGFYGDVFGFGSEVRTMFHQQAQSLTLANGDFVLLIEGDEPMSAPGFDHLGIEMSTRADVDDVLVRVKVWKDRDDRVELKEYPDGALDGMMYHAFYVRFLLPIWFDVQFREPLPSASVL
jgi:hypothetical protein